MVEETYVSFEIAKLLKKKGMDKECFTHYIQKNNSDGTSEAVTTCTQQMAMRWLREVHNIHINAEPDWRIEPFKVLGYLFSVHYSLNPWYEHSNTYNSYEEAVEAALKYSLENLI